MADREMSLGVLFTGRLSARLARDTRRLKSVLVEMNRATVRSGRAAQQSVIATERAGKAVAKQTKNVKKAKDEMGMYGKKIGQVTGGIQRLTAAMKVTAAYGLAASAIFGVINALKQGIVTIFDFDQSLKNLQAITGATDAEIVVLERTIKKVASTTKYSAQEVSDAAILLGQAGFTASESIDAIDAVAMLATGTLSSMTATADLLTTSIRAFGLEAADAGRVSDIFASAVNRSKLTIDKLRTAFNYIGPIAHKAGLSLEEAAASSMLLANSGLRASTIGTGLRQVISRLIAPTDRLRAAFLAAGADMTKLNPAMSDMETIISELVKIVPNAQRAFELFGLRGAAAVSAFTEAGAKGFRNMLEETYRVGTALEMAEKQMEGLAVMAKNLKDKIGLLAVAIGEGGIAGAFRLMLEILRPLVDKLTWLADSLIGRVVVATTTLTAVILALRLALRYLAIQLSAIAFGYTVAAVKTMIVAQGNSLLLVSIAALSTAFKKLWFLIKANPFGIILAGVSLAIIAVKMWTDKIAENTKKFEANIITIDKHIQSLEIYQRKLSEVQVGSLEYRSIMQRLIKDYPKLGDVIDIATMKWTDHGKALKDLVALKMEEKIQNLVKLTGEYGKKIELIQKIFKGFVSTTKTFKELNNALKTNTGLLKLTTQRLAEMLKTYGVDAGSSIENITMLLLKHTDISTDAAERLAKSLKEYFDATAEAALKNADIVKQLSDGWAELYNRTDDARKKDVFKAWQAYNEKNKILLQEAVDYEEMTGDKKAALQKYEIEHERIYRDLLGAAARFAGVQIDLEKRTTKKSLELIDARVRETDEKYDKLIDEMSIKYLRDLSNFKGTQEERAKLISEMNLQEIKLGQARLDDQIALERARITLISQVDAEKLKNVENYYRTVQDIEQRGHQGILDKLDFRLRQEIIRLSQQGLSEQDIIQAKTRIYEEHYAELDAENDRHYNEMRKLVDETYDAIETKINTSGESAEKINEKLRKIDQKRHEDVKKLYDERSEAYKKTIDFLISEEGRLTNAIKAAQEKRKAIEKETADILRGLRYKLLSDHKKWLAEKKRAGELLAKAEEELTKGNIKDAEKHAKEAQSVYARLATEVKDKTGKVILELKKTVQVAEEGVKKAGDIMLEAADKNMRTLEEELGNVKTRLEDVVEKFDDFRDRIREFNAKAQLKLDVRPTIEALQAAERAVKRYRVELAKIPKRIITYVTVEKKFSGISLADEGMSISMQAGGSVPGTGRGDKVPILGEPKEFMEPVPIVKKHGVGFFEALRQNLIPKSLTDAVMSMVGLKSSGFVGMNMNKVFGGIQRMQEGGVVHPSETMTIRFQAGRAELPLTVMGPNKVTRQTVKDFERELIKQGLSYA